MQQIERVEIIRCDWLHGRPWRIDVNGRKAMLSDSEPSHCQIDQAKRHYLRNCERMEYSSSFALHK